MNFKENRLPAFLIAGVAGSLICAVLLFTLPPYPAWTADEPERGTVT